MTEHACSTIIHIAKEIQTIPSPTFSERQRAEYLVEQFSTLSLDDVHIDSIGNVYGKIKGGNASPLIISAHLDSVLTPDINKPIIQNDKQIIGTGIGDNALGVAALIEIGRHLVAEKNQTPGDIWLVGNVGEEGLGNLNGMQQIVDRFKGRVQAYLVLEGIGLGMVQTAALGIHRFRIEIMTKGGHAWSDYGKPSAIHELIALSSRILEVKLPENPHCSVNIGLISGGEAINSLASQAEMQIEFRSEDKTILESLSRTIHKITTQSNRNSIVTSITVIGQRPSGRISEKNAVILTAQAALRSTGITPMFAISSSDASLPISLGYPATCLGITTGRQVHTHQETIDLMPIPSGMAQIYHFIGDLWNC